MSKFRTALLGVAVLTFCATGLLAEPLLNAAAAATPLFDETAEFDHGVTMAGSIAEGLQVALILDYESTNRKVPGLGNLDGLPLPVMRPRTRREVLRLSRGPDGRYKGEFRTLMKRRFGAHYMLRHVMAQVDVAGQSRDRTLLGTHVFFGQIGVRCESLMRVLVKGEAEKHLRLQLDGEQPDLSKHTFGLIPSSGADTRMKLDFVR